MKKSIAGLVLILASVAAFALPTPQDVQAAVAKGNYAQAESMMSEVVVAKPKSAKAHYEYAEMLAHNGRFAKAADEARLARTIDPEIKFTSAAKFQEFEQLLQRERSTTPQARVAPSLSPGMAPAAANRAAPVERSSGLPSWIWLAGLAAVAFVLWRMFSRRAAAGAAGIPGAAMGAAPMNPGPYNPNAPYGQTMGQPMPGQGMGMGGRGGSMLGTGMAVAGGVAGGMLLDRMLHNHGGGNDVAAGDVGGSGLNPAASELESRPIDFGTGNDWDAGSSDVGSSDGGGSDGGGWD